MTFARLPTLLSFVCLYGLTFAETSTGAIRADLGWKEAVMTHKGLRGILTDQAVRTLANPDPQEKRRAAETIGKRMTLHDGWNHDHPEEAEERRILAHALTPAAKDPDPRVSRAAIRAMVMVVRNRKWGLHGEPFSPLADFEPLIALGRSAHTELVALLLESEPIKGVHLTILQAIRGDLHAAWLPPLLYYASQSSGMENALTIHLLSHFDDPRVLPMIVDSLHHDIPDTGNTATWIIEKRYGRKAGPELLRAIESHPNSQLRMRALECLGSFNDRQNTPGVIRALGDPYKPVRDLAARILGAKDESKVIVPLRIRLFDSNPRVREAACLALAGYRVKSAKGAIRRLLKDSDSGVREAAAWALEHLDGS